MQNKGQFDKNEHQNEVKAIYKIKDWGQYLFFA